MIHHGPPVSSGNRVAIEIRREHSVMERQNTGFFFVSYFGLSFFFNLPQVSTTTAEDKHREWCFGYRHAVHRFKVARGEILIL